MSSFNDIQCSHCKSINKTLLADNFYHCNQCGFNYYVENNNCIVSNSKHTIPGNGRNHFKCNFLLLVVTIVVLILLTPYIKDIYNQFNINTYSIVNNSSDEISYQEDQAIEETTEVISDDDKEIDNNTITSQIGDTKVDNINESAHPRIAYVFYQDPKTHNNYLFKATFLTENTDDNDTNVVSIKNENGNLVGYDSLSGNIIPNFNKLIVQPVSTAAAVLYADNDGVIIKNKIDSKYQLEMIDPYNGNVVWTLSPQEIPGVENLTGKFSSDNNTGIELFRDNYRIKLPPKYYVIDKTGNVIGFGKLN